MKPISNLLKKLGNKHNPTPYQHKECDITTERLGQQLHEKDELYQQQIRKLDQQEFELMRLRSEIIQMGRTNEKQIIGQSNTILTSMIRLYSILEICIFHIEC